MAPVQPATEAAERAAEAWGAEIQVAEELEREVARVGRREEEAKAQAAVTAAEAEAQRAAARAAVVPSEARAPSRPAEEPM